MDTKTADTPTETNQTQGCQCQAQIAGILARLDALERDALTVDKIRSMEPSSLIQSLPKVFP